MTISLGGAPGPGEGGLTPIGGRPIQQVLPLAEAQKPQAVLVPAEKAPAMTVPTPEARRATKQPEVKQAPPDSRGQTPTKGAEGQAGSTLADTGASGIGFGLSAGGGGTGSYLDVGDFCCPEYIATMMDLIRRRWDPNQRVPGEVMIKYTILRSGEITGVEVERSSGQTFLDLSALRALTLARQLPPLPSAFTEDHLTVHLNFQYRR
jgi:TonB family protein